MINWINVFVWGGITIVGSAIWAIIVVFIINLLS